MVAVCKEIAQIEPTALIMAEVEAKSTLLERRSSRVGAIEACIINFERAGQRKVMVWGGEEREGRGGEKARDTSNRDM